MNAISLEGVTLRYRIPSERIQSFKEYAIRKIKRLVVFDEVEAVRDFDLTVAPGETLGVVGRNGAGKSTLFKLIARVLYPTEGRVVVIGRIAPLLELGLGLHGELTGRENVMLQGALLGFARNATRHRSTRSCAAELRAHRLAHPHVFLRHTRPFRRRTDSEPDILRRRTLSVGDERFQKCKNGSRLCKAGNTSSFHDLPLVVITVRAVWIHKGRLVRDGDAESVTAAYHAWSSKDRARRPGCPH
jgi:ABC-2 type transport system ATP-binding protein/lipopolysaccharide transport system ATP-binding protein